MNVDVAIAIYEAGEELEERRTALRTHLQEFLAPLRKKHTYLKNLQKTIPSSEEATALQTTIDLLEQEMDVPEKLLLRTHVDLFTQAPAPIVSREAILAHREAQLESDALSHTSFFNPRCSCVACRMAFDPTGEKETKRLNARVPFVAIPLKRQTAGYYDEHGNRVTTPTPVQNTPPMPRSLDQVIIPCFDLSGVTVEQ